jgi:hypothetical protein
MKTAATTIQPDRRPYQNAKAAAPSPEDAVPKDLCPRCGLKGQHPKASDCIASLRDRLARFE